MTIDIKDLVGFIFQITDKVLWNTFKKNEIGDVILPFVVLRRLDCILEPVSVKVRSVYVDKQQSVTEEELDTLLRKAAGGLQFYNVSSHTLESLAANSKTIELDIVSYLGGFSAEVRDIIENFQFDKVISRLVKNKLLYPMIEAISQIDLHTNKVDNHSMGYLFEELIRISNEQSNETAGEHFTPRDVIELMVKIIFDSEKKILLKKGEIRTIYDPAMGTGGMVNLAKNYIVDDLTSKNRDRAELRTYGQEINEQSYAIAKSEALITGENVDNIRHGNTFTEDQFSDYKFHYMLANPPYGVTWSKDAKFIRNESLSANGRFSAGLPSTSDGQLLFLQHMISKMLPGDSKIAVVTNGSPLFTGKAGSGESNIRKWILTNDLLDCIVALPKDLFYNTGINTFIWFLTNKKLPNRVGKVQLINATKHDAFEDLGFSKPEKRSLGNKRNRIDSLHIDRILNIYQKFEESDFSKIYSNDYFGYYQISIERPLLDENGEIILDARGRFKSDAKKSDKEFLPLNVDIEQYFKEEVLPHVPDAWINYEKTRIGYEINFSKYFYQYQKPQSSGEILKIIKELEFGGEDLRGNSDLLKEFLNGK